MELALNLVWTLLSLTIILWFTNNRHNWSGKDRVRAVVALSLVVMILLPAISMTDDLLATRFPAEIEQMQSQHKQAILHAVAEPFASALEFVQTGCNLHAVSENSASFRETKIPHLLDKLQGFKSTHGVRPPLELRTA